MTNPSEKHDGRAQGPVMMKLRRTMRSRRRTSCTGEHPPSDLRLRELRQFASGALLIVYGVGAR